MRQVRLGEKEALDSTLRWFEARADRIASLEFYQVPRPACGLRVCKPLGSRRAQTASRPWSFSGCRALLAALGCVNL